MKRKDESLCWNCTNYNRCKWSYGKPVAGWTAQRVHIRSSDGTYFDSYFVHDCPEFKCDRIVRVSVESIAKILNSNQRTTARRLSLTPRAVATDLLQHGYRLRRYGGDPFWYVEQLRQPQYDHDPNNHDNTNIKETKCNHNHNGNNRQSEANPLLTNKNC